MLNLSISLMRAFSASGARRPSCERQRRELTRRVPRFTSLEIGNVIQMLRELQRIKQAVLAADANVSEKIIERAEGGEEISEDSCRRIVRALGVKENALTDELYIPSPGEAARIQKHNADDFQRTHRLVSVTPINGSRDILPLFRCYALIPD